MEILNKWLGAIGKELGYEIKLNDEGVCAIECEENIKLVIESEEGSPVFHLSAPLIEIPGDRESLLVLFGRALSLNLFLIETRGTTIAFAEEIGQIMLCFMQEKQVCNAQKFASLIEGFHQTAIDIRRKLEAFSQEETIGVSAPPPLVDFV